MPIRPAAAFAGGPRVATVRGYTPRGPIARAWDAARARVGPGGAEAAPAAGAVSWAFGVDLFVVCGAGATYSWHAPGGAGAAAGGACNGAPFALPVGFGVSFEFSTPTPNFTVIGN